MKSARKPYSIENKTTKESIMTFKSWIFSEYPENDSIAGQWKFPHIFTLCLCIGIILFIAYFFRKKDRRTRENVLRILAAVILFFELTRRIINLIKGNAVDFTPTNFGLTITWDSSKN